ncbi:MAG: bacillithiol biosynthesis deacetylase BshB1 [Balneolaceae bacterium]|nr:bacillithiol biosynthesis deacetylase BshB1 [Balneolaceae bacterium]
MTPNQESINIVAFGAHPDDVELSAGGTIAKAVSEGKSVVLVDLTKGEMGSRGTPEIRLEEAKAAASILGASDRLNMELPDTLVSNTRENQLKVIQILRTYRPQVVFANAPQDRNPDHGHGSALIRDSFFLSGLVKIETKDNHGQLQEPWRPSHLLFYMQDTVFEPDLIIDITDHLETKEASMLAHASQVNVQTPGDEPETYISSPTFFESIRARTRTYGHRGGCTHGEPFKLGRAPMMLSSLDALFDRKIAR